MTADAITALRLLWQQAFGDSEETLDCFFATAFSPDRCNYLSEENRPVSALYWFDCSLDGHKLAYLYALATDTAHRGKGLAHKLMKDTHNRLKESGYSGAVLVPGEASLYGFYEKMGYRTATAIEEFTCVAGKSPVYIRQITSAEYTAWRRNYLPAGGVRQERETLSYLATYGEFYLGEDFLLAATKKEEDLLVHEILGNTNCCSNILCALNCKTGRFRTQGSQRPFAMFLPLGENCPAPTYFGLALD